MAQARLEGWTVERCIRRDRHRTRKEGSLLNLPLSPSFRAGRVLRRSAMQRSVSKVCGPADNARPLCPDTTQSAIPGTAPELGVIGGNRRIDRRSAAELLWMARRPRKLESWKTVCAVTPSACDFPSTHAG